MNEVKTGDMLWVYIKGANNDYGFGEVVEVYTSESGVEIFDFHCLVNGGRRSGLAKNVIEKPTGRMVAKLSHAQIELKEVLKEKR